jgi:cold-inducible RNA-binding protein
MMQDSSQHSQINNKKLYFGNLPWSLNDETLKELVADFGEVVEAKVITDNYSGRSKGFGFVEFSTEEEAQAAIDALNESEIDGRKIFVNVAKPKAPREDRPQRRDNRRSFDRRDGDRGNSRY